MERGETAAQSGVSWGRVGTRDRRSVAARLRRIGAGMRRNPLGAFGLFLILMLITIGIFAPVLAPHPVNTFVGNPSMAPSADFPFGTDRLGQDILSRVIMGARISLQVGALATAIGLAGGVTVGVVSGYKGGAIENVMQRLVDTWIAFPGLLLLLILVRVLGPSMTNVVIVIGIFMIPGLARLIHGATLSEKSSQYLEAARSVGASDTHIIVRHVLPNLVPLVIVLSSALLSQAILAEASLSFLGLGIPPPNPSWGADVSASRTYYPIHVWVAFFPGLAISLSVLGFVLAGDMLRDVLDPRLRGR
jgi:peptide/nickel transport system permease protein